MTYTPIEVARFWAKVRIPDTPHHINKCWLWRGALTAQGYGQIKIAGKPTRAHRVAYELFYGPMAEGSSACHKCDTPRCCNPYHVYEGNAQTNAMDRSERGRQADVRAFLKTRKGYKYVWITENCKKSVESFSPSGIPIIKSLKELAKIRAAHR